MFLQPCRRSNLDANCRTILLVEDEPFVREATCGILQSAGFMVFPAQDAQEAMEIYEQRNCGIDLLMTDLVLPGKDGDELAREVRKLSPEVAVLLTSGYAEAANEVESPENRTYFLAKPYSRRSLVEKIEAILSRTQEQAAQAG